MNVWQAQAMERAARAQEPSYEREMIAGEYAAHQNDAKTCTCGSKADYKSTVGAWKCPIDGSLILANGKVI